MRCEFFPLFFPPFYYSRSSRILESYVGPPSWKERHKFSRQAEDLGFLERVLANSVLTPMIENWRVGYTGGYFVQKSAGGEGNPRVLKPKNICGNANFIFHTRPAGYMVPSYLKICIMVPWHVYVHTSPSPPLARSPWARCSRVRAVSGRRPSVCVSFPVYERTKYNASRVATVLSPPARGLPRD